MSTKGLSPAELQAIAALLDEALELAPAQRAPWLEDLARRQPALHRPLERLLSLHGQDRWTGLPGQGAAAALWPAAAARTGGLAPGDSVGPYRLVRELGLGGMASVWLATRADGAFQREVALKLPQISRLQPALAERFARERDILAKLVHPNIARFYDAGISDDGLPYLAMELVDGQTLTDYCDAQRLPVEARLQVFCQVLDALQHAHANLVIHRDLKPSNILVTGDGQVRLLDFGVATLLDAGDRSAASELTQTSGRALTMAYASPEQVRGEPLSTASDVYSLGVVLFELLAGRRPYGRTGDSPAQWEAAILDAEPARPGVALTHAADAEALAALRRSTPTRLARQLDGELADVLRKALAKTPAERYDGCAALRDDLRRYLEGRPVSAQPASRLYQLHKFVGRNRLAVGAGVGVLLAVLAGAGAALWQAELAREQARRAQLQEARAVAVQDFLLGLFRTNSDAEPDPLRARETTARQLLDIGAARVREQLRTSPEVQDTVLETLASMYGDVGLDQQAADLAAERVALRERLFGADDPRVAVALLDHAASLNATADAAQAPGLLQRARRIADGAPGDQTALRIRTLFAQAQAARYADVSTALGFVGEARALIERHGVAGDPLRRALYLEGLTLSYLGDCAAALQSLQRANTISRASAGPQPRWQIPELTAISATAQCLGDMALAESSLLEALDMSRRLNGDEHIDTLHVLTRLLRVYHDTSRAALARELDERIAGRMGERVVQENANLYTTLLRSAATRAHDVGRIDIAATQLDELVRRQRGFAGTSTVLATALQQRARTHAALGRFDEALRDIDEAIEVARRSLGARAQPAALLAMRVDRASIRLWRGETVPALEELDAAAAALPAGDQARPLAPTVGRWRAAALRQAGRAADAADTARAALAAHRAALRPVDLPRLQSDLLLELGLALQALGQLAPARQALTEALALREAQDDEGSVWRARVELALADVLLAMGEPRRARPLADAARRRLAKHAELAPQLGEPARALVARLRGPG